MEEEPPPPLLTQHLHVLSREDDMWGIRGVTWVLCPCHVRPRSLCPGINNPCDLLWCRDNRAQRACVRECQVWESGRHRSPGPWVTRGDRTTWACRSTVEQKQQKHLCCTCTSPQNTNTLCFDICNLQAVCSVASEPGGCLKWDGEDVASISTASLTRGMSEYNPPPPSSPSLPLSSVSVNVQRSADSPCLAQKHGDRQPARERGFHPYSPYLPGQNPQPPEKQFKGQTETERGGSQRDSSEHCGAPAQYTTGYIQSIRTSNIHQQ